MSDHHYVIFVCVLLCVNVASEELNLPEGSACLSDGVNGTCVNLYKCDSTIASHIYREAAYGDDHIPKLPVTCSTVDGVPIVCCTDCNIRKEEVSKDRVVGPSGVILEKKGPKAQDKCLDYFQRLPYSCRGKANVKMEKHLNLDKKCHNYNLEIVTDAGNQSADRKEFPHVVLLGYSKSNYSDAGWYCSGFIISERFILTAGHCLNAPDIGPVKYARFAVKSRNESLETWKVMKIKRRIPHPEYNHPNAYNDIALLETESDFQFDENCLPVCLDTGDVETNEVYLSGWGATERRGHGTLANTLKVVQMQEVSKTECDNTYPPRRKLRNGINHSAMMCYHASNNDVGSCEGDGGAPVQFIGKDCLYTAVGVTSMGRECGSGFPDVYTRVSHYIPWIESIVWP